MLDNWCTDKYLCDILANDLDMALAKKIRRKMRVIPEEFYKDTGLCIVAPDNCKEFLRGHMRWAQIKGRRIQWDTQEFWSGSSRYSATAYKRNMYMGFPMETVWLELDE